MVLKCVEYCETCRNRQECADDQKIPLADFLVKSRNVDWCEITCDGYERKI